MSGKARPSLLKKTLNNVTRPLCNLSITDKNCIKEVFKRYEEQRAEIEKFKKLNNITLFNEKYGFVNLFGNVLVYSKSLKDYNDMIAELKSEAVKEFAEKLKEDAEYICDDSYIEKELKEYVDNYVKLKYDNNDAFIEGTELALDYGLPVPEEDLEKYEKIVDKSKNE